MKKVLLVFLVIGLLFGIFKLLTRETLRPLPETVYFHEFDDLLSDHFDTLDKDADYYLDEKEINSDQLALLDHNKNGKVSIVEYLSQSKELFESHDKDKSLALEAHEIKEVLK